MTAGIISAEGRDIGDGPYDRFLQIDAPINRGNSGGPTFNMKGEVVGVNTAIYSPSGGSVGIGFAIPAATVDSVIGALEHGGIVPRGYLGVNIQPVTAEMAESLGMKTDKGAIVAEAMPGTPAAEAGIKAGDVITKLNGQVVDGRVRPHPPHRVVQAQRQGRTDLPAQRRRKDGFRSRSPTRRTETVAKADASQAKEQGALGIQIAPAKEVDGAGDKGVAIVGVDPNGTAAEQGLAAGNVILDVSGKPVSTPEDVKAGIASAKSQGRKAVMMRIQTADGAHFVAVPFPKA